MTPTGRNGSQGFSSEDTPAGTAESVPGYRDLARIGHGGFSVVYRAVQESFERAVALKVLTVGSDEDTRRRFLREVRLASKLSGHPHVVTVLDTGTTDTGRPYLAMDLYDGGSMKQRLAKSGPLSAEETALLGAKIAEALAAAHSLGVIHRDVKPNNILISRFGEPALADFGVSCLLDSSSSASVLDIFSPQHAAPELMTRGVPTKSSDVYALGSTLYELLTGRPPFGAESRDVRSLMWRVMSEPAPRPDSGELPGLADAIVKAMAKDPDDRFPDAAEFARVLRALIPEGRTATLLLPGAAAAGAAAGLGAVGAVDDGEDLDDDATGVRTGAYVSADSGATGGSAGYVSDDTSAPYPRGADETMVRPDRDDESAAEPPAKGRGGRGRAGGGREGARENARGGARRRRRKPLVAAVVLLVLGATGWALIASQNPSAVARGEASAPPTTASASAKASAARTSAKPSASPSASPSHRATHTASASAAAVHTSAAPSTSAATSTGPLLSLPGTYNRFRNAGSGNCLDNPSGGSLAQSSCGSSQSLGWEYSEPLTGILGAVTGEFELVNERSGDCLTASSGGVDAEACTGDSSQMWTKAGGGSSTELHNVGDSQCLVANGSGVTAGACSTSDQADLWSEDGTV